MDALEFILLRAAGRLELRGEQVTAHSVAEETFSVAIPRRVGYVLRSLVKRGWVRVDGRVHGGARRYSLSTKGSEVANG